jgi:ubiquitin carboxyl-terminal hydrolase 25/28
LQKKLDKAYSGLNKRKYVLQSILMHDGQYAESGHYYTYIYDFERKIWRKYDDTNVTEESEQVVLQNSFGGPNNYQSAYFLVYQSEQNILPKGLKGPLQSYNLES